MSQYIDPRSKIFYHTDRLGAIKAGQRPAPVNVEIDLSNRCSLGCAWCHFAYTHTRGPLAGKRNKPADAVAGGDLMDMALALRILHELPQVGVKSVTWTGGGEPTLHPEFDKIIYYAAGQGLEQGMYTHGGHIAEMRAAHLKKLFSWVYVSLDECDSESYRQNKGANKFDHATAGVRNLVAAEGNATVGIGFLLHKGNLSRLGDMVKLGKSLGVDYMQFRPTIGYDQAAPGQQVEDVFWLNGAINELRRYAGDPQVITDPWRFEMYRDWTTHGYSTCNWSALQTVITPNGKVWRCTNKREHPDAELGDLSVESFAKVWGRSGGPCQVNGKCRIMCRGHIANITLDAVMTEPVHKNFI